MADAGNENAKWTLSPVSVHTVQCAKCWKWRVIPCRQIYQKIREKITEIPWCCEDAAEWTKAANCDVEEDISPTDTSHYWLIDKFDIPTPLPQWQRVVNVMRSGSRSFAYVNYIPPDGPQLTSLRTVKKYMKEHPESVPEPYVHDGLAEDVPNLNAVTKFSFTAPEPKLMSRTATVRKKRTRTRTRTWAQILPPTSLANNTVPSLEQTPNRVLP